MKRFFFATLLVSMGCLTTQADYSQNFDTADGTTDLGDGSAIWSNDGLNQVLGGRLRLTEVGTNGSNASFKIPAQAGSAAGWTAVYDLEMTHASPNTPADGLSFSYGVLSGDTGGLAAEEGWTADENHLAFQVDTWKWDDPAQDAGFTIRSQPATVAQDNKGFAHVQLNNENAIIGNDETVRGRVAIGYDGATNTATYRTSGFRVNADFRGVAVPEGFTASDDHLFGIRARTGGHNQTTIIDNLNISVGAPARFCDTSPADVCFDFDANDEGVAVYGDSEVRGEGGLDGGYLKVTDAANGQRGKIILPDVGGGGQFVFGGRTGGANAAHHIDNLEASVVGDRIEVSASLRVGGGTDRPADGFSFNFVRPGDPLLAENTDGWAGIGGEPENLPEEGSTTGISIGFDEWQSGPNAQETGNYTVDDVVGMSLRIDGQLAGQAPLTTLNGALDDITSLQTGGNGDGDELGWATLTISAPLEGASIYNTTVSWKGANVEFVPEPATNLLVLTSIASLFLLRRKK